MIFNQLKKTILLFLFFYLAIIFSKTLLAQSIQQQTELDNILNSAEKIFKFMEIRDFRGIWEGITEKSKKRIIEDIYKYAEKQSKKEKKANPLNREMIFEDFNNCGPLSREYWNAFLENFDPKTALEQSAWKMGKIEGNYAEVIIHYKKSERPAIVQMYKEKGVWKLGLVETFWTWIK
ncbi:MAG TPA: hypothetical protein PKZ54_05120 [Syntrophorhabdaceae bacterium]|nr:hypothetical protein [Syntrophorhabdaceae bacterium]